jgi:hypothetical protein
MTKANELAKLFYDLAFPVRGFGDPYSEAGVSDYCHNSAIKIADTSMYRSALERIAQGVDNPQEAAKQALEVYHVEN